ARPATQLSTLSLHAALPICMSCAACAHRIEHKLNKLDGVSASVNYATERAVVRGVDDPADALEVIRGAGYDAAVRHGQDDEWSRDRKSTRLNSSHVSISYAV